GTGRSDGTIPDKRQCARDDEDDRLLTSQEASIKKWTKLWEMALFAWKQGRELKLPGSFPTSGVDIEGQKGNNC
ncbi:MAG: hypothetical protein ACE5K2_05865, partial [Candidatus Zixiibacteriota bacterium]